ncbi:MAG: hypothetical protein J1F10_04355, partial [Muribaculaceae bacterium]|nr:hypothetical protein [Muribaculaceae bacterium]
KPQYYVSICLCSIRENHDVISQPAPDPKRWRYIFYILAIGGVILLYLKRTPILDWLRRILSGLRHIFSK